MLELFSDYLPFISFLVTIVVNIILIKLKVNWVLLLVGNILVMVVMGFLGLSEYNIITVVVKEVANIVKDVFENLFKSIFDGLNPFKK